MSETGVERDSLLPRTQPPETPDIDIPREGNIIERLDLMPEVKDRRAVFLLTVCRFILFVKKHQPGTVYHHICGLQ